VCRFKSGIVVPTGDLLYNWFTDSHEDLIDMYNLKGTNFVWVEYTSDTIELLDTSSLE